MTMGARLMPAIHCTTWRWQYELVNGECIIRQHHILFRYGGRVFLGRGKCGVGPVVTLNVGGATQPYAEALASVLA